MLRANGDTLISLGFFPFMPSPSKHSEPFFSSLLEMQVIENRSAEFQERTHPGLFL
jgi:hypothetical protein